MEQQFTEAEKRFVLAEAIKASNIQVEALQHLLFQYNVVPDWEQMLLPNGRNIAQCKHALNSIQLAPPSQLSTPQPFPQTFLNPAPPTYSSSPGSKRQSVHLQPGPEQKRPRKSGAETPTLARDLLPKPAGPNGGSPMSTMSSSPAATTNPKKRGRPSKADVERKQREAIERGDIIPPAPTSQSQAGPSGQDDNSRTSQAPKTILPAPRHEEYPQNYGNTQSVLTPGQGSQMVLDHGSPASMGAEPPGKKRKPRLPPKPKAPKPGESQFSILTPVSQAGQGENAYAPVSAETSQAGPVAGPPEAGNQQVAPATTQEPAPPSTQPKSDEK